MGPSPNVAELHGLFEDDERVILVIQLCTGGELWERIEEGQYGERQAARLCRDILATVAAFHARGIVMRDIKPNNFLFESASPKAPLKAVDFGIAQYCEPQEFLSQRCGTPLYVAPEVLDKHYSQKADVWSAGVLCYMLLAGRLPWKGEMGIPNEDVQSGDMSISRKDAFKAIMFGDVDFESPPWDRLSADAHSFMAALLQRDPEKRATAAEALTHPWLSDEHHAERPAERPFSWRVVRDLFDSTISNLPL
jgi:calcium-dependent protein kinase